MVDYQELVELSQKRLANTSIDFVRSFMNQIDWNDRLVGLKGARGTGKTTLLLQYIKLHCAEESAAGRVLFVSLDNLWFSTHSLTELADSFVKNSGTKLFLDEVHKCPNWSQVLKNLYDNYPELSIVFTGSSLLEILNARADLSRRAVVYTLQGLSFREYLALAEHERFDSYSLEKILDDASRISGEISSRIKPLALFSSYLHSGYYPYFVESKNTYDMKLEETVNMILDVELPLLRGVELSYVPKLKQLLGIISESSPFIPNISKIAGAIGLNRQTVLMYLQYLNDAHLTKSLYKDSRGISTLQKPDKLYLENTNLMYLFRCSFTDSGNARETFLQNQLSYHHTVEVSDASDFYVDRTWTIECGGKNKTGEQIKNTANAFIAADGIEIASGTKIPLWLFGFLY